MPNSRHLCVLAAEIVGSDHLVARLGEAEAARALERCLNRIDLAIGGSGGEIVARDAAAAMATFEQCDSGVMAACEAIERVRKLPPVSGAQMKLRIGIHYGSVDANQGEGLEGARRIRHACAAGQSLASSAVVAELSPAVRNFASAEAFCDEIHGTLPWPVFTVGNQLQETTTAATSISSRPIPPPSTPPLTGSKRPARMPPPQPGPRLRLHHQQKTIFVEENRPVVLMGRELGNDIVIIDPRASRQHARIERRRDGFVLIDQSTNGCFVAFDGQEECGIKDGEYPLSAAGRIGCGFSSQEFEDDLVFFEIV
ncbi:MAG: FHA domain-containing protein [Azoarcus sp.]|nr:FHA domain-containing protein [Azoarcus sp.]